ncbi:MAG: hypothetical protein HY843_02465 [Bdellovibrio sp.]|nr:hypothetical protein [Bdellovibrio sp.]
MLFKIPFFTLSLIVPINLCNTSASATSFIDQPFPEQIQESPIVIRGTIGDNSVQWVEGIDHVRRPFTYYDIEISEVLKGKVSEPIIKIRELGGTKDGLGMEVPGTAKFELKEDVILTINEINGDNSYDLKNMIMSKFNIKKDENNEEILIGAGLNSENKSWTLSALRELIRLQKTKENKKSPTSPKPDNIQMIPSILLPQSKSDQKPQVVNNPINWLLIIIGCIGLLMIWFFVQKLRK